MKRPVVLGVLLTLGAVGTVAFADGEVATVRESKFELFVHDPARSVAFYAQLGFRLAHAKDDGYSTLESGSTVIAVAPLPWWLPLHWLGFLRSPPLGTEIVLYASDVEKLRAALEEAGYAPTPIVLQSWGNRDFRITDPDGYYVRVSEGTAVPPDR